MPLDSNKDDAPDAHKVPANARPIRHLNQIDLARRWSMSERTLERWRWLKQGPRYLKIGGRVLYRVEDIENFETARAR